MGVKNNRFQKFSLISILSIILILLFVPKGYCADAEITSVSCGVPSATASWPRNTFTTTCSVDITVNDTALSSLGVYVNNYTTTANSGNGSNITLTGPEHRLKADGPAQGGTPVNITTNNTYATATIVKSGINANASYDVDIEYTTYEADYGNTNYTQNFVFVLFDEGTTGVIDTYSDSMTFTIENKQYINISAGPSVTLTTSAQVFSSNTDYDSNTLTVSVKANNTWKLQARLDAVPTDAAKTIPVTSVYYRCSGSGFDNLSASKTQFAVVNTYYDAAQNTGGVNRTGTSNSIDLNAVNVSVIYNLRTTALFEDGTYTANTTFNLISPR